MLVAPLDWGLGHASRCIPLITKLLNAGFKVIIAAEGDQKILLQTAFPDLEILHLQGYRIKYSTAKWRTIFKIIFQIPKILIGINREKNWLRAVIKQKPLDLVIADNRFGLHNKNLVSVFITHQLHIKTGLGKICDYIIQKINYRFINRFDRCWIPDVQGENNLAGKLSHPASKPSIPVIYLGILSRIQKQDIPVNNKLLVLLSGPEPQRTLLEQRLLPQLNQYRQPVVLVRGLPASQKPVLSSSPFLTIYDHLSGPCLQELINASEIILSRSGYSTIMEVIPLGKKCIFIPTPGQAEQQYLAHYLSRQQFCCASSQDHFSLPIMIEKLQSATLRSFSSLPDDSNADKAIAAVLLLLQANNK